MEGFLLRRFGSALLLVLVAVACFWVLPAEASVRVAALQMHAVFKDLEANYASLERLVTKAASEGARLIVTPEMVTSGYTFNSREEIAPYVETADQVASRLTPLAVRHDCYIAVGFPEVDEKTDIYYNSAALVGPEGLVGLYRKTHLWSGQDGYWSAWGNLGVPVFETSIGKVAMTICMDSAFFEPFRLAALNGADIMAFLTNSSGQAVATLQARAMENGIYVVSSNRSDVELGFKMKGCSAVWDPMGEKLAEAGPDEEAIVYATIDPGYASAVREGILAERRPTLYRDLSLFPSPWDYRVDNENRQVNLVCLAFEPQGEAASDIATVTALLEGVQGLKEGLPTVVVLPELALAGPAATMTREKALEAAETFGQGPASRAMADLARREDATIAFGFVELDGTDLYNSLGVVDETGAFVGIYRKTHLDGADRAWARPGDSLKVLKTSCGRLGLLIGRDVFFPETATVLAVNRAEVVLLATAAPASASRPVAMSDVIHPESGRAVCLWDGKAKDNLFYLAVADAVGPGTAIYGMDPVYGLDSPRYGAPGQGTVTWTVDLHPDWWITQKDFLGSRRMDDVYNALATPR